MSGGCFSFFFLGSGFHQFGCGESGRKGKAGKTPATRVPSTSSTFLSSFVSCNGQFIWCLFYGNTRRLCLPNRRQEMSSAYGRLWMLVSEWRDANPQLRPPMAVNRLCWRGALVSARCSHKNLFIGIYIYFEFVINQKLNMFVHFNKSLLYV